MLLMDPFSARNVAAGYGAAVDDYVAAFADDLARLPVDREVLDAASRAAGPGWVVEAGCGPAPAAQHIGERAPDLVGVDITEPMLATARRRNPGLHVVAGDLRAIPLRTGSAGLVTAWYCLQHVARSELPGVLAEVARVLVPGGVLAAATHLGKGAVVMEEFLGHAMTEPIGGTFHGREELVDLFTAAGFSVELERTRGPLPHEHDSQRLYLVARR